MGRITDLKKDGTEYGVRKGTQYGVKFQYTYESKEYQRMHYVCIPKFFSSTEIPLGLEPGNPLRLIMIPNQPKSALPLETWKKAKLQNFGDRYVISYFFGSGFHSMPFIIGKCAFIFVCYYYLWILAMPFFIFGLDRWYHRWFYTNILLNGGDLVTARAEVSSPLLA